MTDGFLHVVRSRGSFGTFDVTGFHTDFCLLVSVKSVRQQYWNPKPELLKIGKVDVPCYCCRELWVWWSPRSDREKKGWEIFRVLPSGLESVRMYDGKSDMSDDYSYSGCLCDGI
jgi:hypothetical protein